MLRRYAVLKGRPLAHRRGLGHSPHFQLLISDGRSLHRAAINIRSAHWPSEVAFAHLEPFDHPLTERLARLPYGLHRVEPQPDGLALDYVRGGLCATCDFQPLPDNGPGHCDDLNDRLGAIIDRVRSDPQGYVCLYGEPWGPWYHRRDRQFRFLPSRGMHDVHMNQGNSAAYAVQNGVWQDGGLIACLPDRRRWLAFLLKFQSQSLLTDDATGHALPPLVPPQASA